MSLVVTAWIKGNEQAMAVIDALATVGIDSERVRVFESIVSAEHGSDEVTQRSVWWGLVGLTVGSLVGWLVMSWWSLSAIGAVWTGLVGAQCGARAGGYAAMEKAPVIAALVRTRIMVEVSNRPQAEQVRGIVDGLQARSSMIMQESTASRMSDHGAS